jgi:hypothetical protein
MVATFAFKSGTNFLPYFGVHLTLSGFYLQQSWISVLSRCLKSRIMRGRGIYITKSWTATKVWPLNRVQNCRMPEWKRCSHYRRI